VKLRAWRIKRARLEGERLRRFPFTMEVAVNGHE
jgi:hypothetical protein